jgi:polysaccharide deacetylase family protein (PEP-CTERM system associated)
VGVTPDEGMQDAVKAQSVVNALTIDLEDWYQVSNLDRYLGRELWDQCPSRLEGTTYRLLALLDQAKVKATFFVLGWNAERCASLVREIATRGHEVALHGYHHALIYEQTPVQFAWEVARCCDLLAEITGERPAGFRAASFSVVRQSLWALDVLHEHGLRYDSSIFPVRHGRYGIPGSPRFPYRIVLEGGAITELPISTLAWAGRCVGFSGGAYLRLLPYALVRWGIKRLNGMGQPAVVYLHPWEIDPEQPRVNALPFALRVRCYGNLERTEGKLRRLLREFRFAPARQVLESRPALPAYALEPSAAGQQADGRLLFRPCERTA